MAPAIVQGFIALDMSCTRLLSQTLSNDFKQVRKCNLSTNYFANNIQKQLTTCCKTLKYFNKLNEQFNYLRTTVTTIRWNSELYWTRKMAATSTIEPQTSVPLRHHRRGRSCHISSWTPRLRGGPLDSLLGNLCTIPGSQSLMREKDELVVVHKNLLQLPYLYSELRLVLWRKKWGNWHPLFCTCCYFLPYHYYYW